MAERYVLAATGVDNNTVDNNIIFTIKYTKLYSMFLLSLYQQWQPKTIKTYVQKIWNITVLEWLQSKNWE